MKLVVVLQNRKWTIHKRTKYPVDRLVSSWNHSNFKISCLKSDSAELKLRQPLNNMTVNSTNSMQRNYKLLPTSIQHVFWFKKSSGDWQFDVKKQTRRIWLNVKKLWKLTMHWLVKRGSMKMSFGKAWILLNKIT